MPCDCSGWPPSPADHSTLLQSAENAINTIHELEKKLKSYKKKNEKLEKELKTLKEAFKLIGGPNYHDKRNKI